jgi:hypothetical protein
VGLKLRFNPLPWQKAQYNNDLRIFCQPPASSNGTCVWKGVRVSNGICV